MSRLLAEPKVVEVMVAEGVPRWLQSHAGRQRVAVVFARWRVEADWWRSPVSREYWKLQFDTGVCEVYQDRLSGSWWLSRIYD